MSRRQARERALQVLFQVDMSGVDQKEAFHYMNESFGDLSKNKEFAERLVSGTLDNLQSIDRVITSVSKDWDIDRMAGVDKNLMRLALYEIFFCEDIPKNVSVNEAVELGKVYGGEESGRFINGILGRVLENPEEYRPVPE